MPLDVPGVIQAHVHAIAHLLVASAQGGQGLFFCAGDPMDAAERDNFARMAAAHDADVIHLEFTSTAGCYLTGLNLIMPRRDRCLIAMECQLYLAKNVRRALVIPRAQVRGHFAIVGGELVHRDGKPNDLAAGAERASRRLERMMRSSPPLRDDIAISVVNRKS